MFKLLRALLPFKDIGWVEHGEQFTRFTLAKTRWGNLYLHRLICPDVIPHCHDHPWWFRTIILWGGYWEWSDAEPRWSWRGPGACLYRPALWRHNIHTDFDGVWSLVLTGPKSRDWSMTSCDLC